jgi:AcrR family transcriptional regulator
MEKHIKKVRTDKDTLKARIAEQAKHAFVAHGIKAVRMDDIASAEGISKRTLYELFADKESLLLEVMKDFHQDDCLKMKEIAQQSHNVMEIILQNYHHAIQHLQDVNRLFVEELKFYPKVQEYLSELRKDELVAIKRFYQRGVDEGLFHADLNYDIVCVMFREQISTLLNSEACRSFTMAEIYRTVALTHIRGIATQKGLSMIHEQSPDFEL